MKRRIMIIPFAALVMMAALFASLVSAQEEPGELPRHGHILVLHPEIDENGELSSYRKCVDLANNIALPLHAHHENVHFGQAGQALFGAGHAVVPTAPFPGVPFGDCAEFEAIFGPGTQ